MELPLVSVIIPTYNRAEYLKQAIESVLAQTYAHFELLILDNCSTDHTSEIVNRFSDLRIKYIRHQCNIRVLANWSYGIYWAQGEYLCILGDDDWYSPTFISSRINAFSKFENIVAVFSAYDICNSIGEIQRTLPLSFTDDCVLSGNKLMEYAVSGWFIGATLYKREIIQRLFERVLMAGKACDTFLNISIAISGKQVAWISDKSLFYRNHENQDTTKDIELILIGHFAACSLPMMFDECIGYRKFLVESSSWALRNLESKALSEGRYKMTLRFSRMELSTNYFRIRAWLRLILIFISTLRNKK